MDRVVLLLYRTSRWLAKNRVPFLSVLFDAVNRIVFSCVIPHTAEIGNGVRLGYGGLGVVIHRDAQIGDRVQLAAGVTIGGNGMEWGTPTIHDDAYLGTGAKILGPVLVGAGAIVGANAVVVADVPARAIAVGVPARVVRVLKPGEVGLVHRREETVLVHGGRESEE